MHAKALLLGAALALLPVAAQADEPLRVVASFSILGDMVSQVGGEDVEVTTLVGPDADAHTFEPSPRDVRTLGDADLVVTNGLQFETWMPRLVRTSGFSGRDVVASQGVTPIAFDEDAHDHGHDHAHHGHDHGAEDPHAWQDLANGVIYVRNIVEGLSGAAPEHADTFRERGEAYVRRLEALDRTVREAFDALPPERRRVVTSHDAFGYFGAAYGLEFIAPEGRSTEASASAADVARVIDQIRAENISAVFVESMADSRVVERISSETGARVGGTLFSDALTGPDGAAPTYERMFEHNMRTILDALRTS